MPFPNIVTDRPVGTQMVSTIDDFERETRTWLKQCMQTISGYPDVDTVGVKSWTTATRPSYNPNSNLLLGYNTDTNSLELINADGNTIEVLSNETKKSIALLAHPVGDYVWTSNASFNPANEWGGTWERIQDGRVLISNNGSHAVGSTGGAETVTLALTQIPSHSHPHTHKHKHSRGTMNITGTMNAVWEINTTPIVSGAFGYQRNVGNSNECGDDGSPRLIWNFDASRSWSGYTSEDATGASAHAQGGGQAHNNMQPFRTAILWHRTA